MARSQVIELRADVAAIVLGMEPHVAQVGTNTLQMPRQQLQIDRLSHCQAIRDHATSNSPAAPMPPPMHIVQTTSLAPRRLPSISACPTMRAPDIP